MDPGLAASAASSASLAATSCHTKRKAAPQTMQKPKCSECPAFAGLAREEAHLRRSTFGWVMLVTGELQFNCQEKLPSALKRLAGGSPPTVLLNISCRE